MAVEDSSGDRGTVKGVAPDENGKDVLWVAMKKLDGRVTPFAEPDKSLRILVFWS